MVFLLDSSVLSVTHKLNFFLASGKRESRKGRRRALVASASSQDDGKKSSTSSQKPTRLVTFLGKGGSGKTTASVFAAQQYALAGFNTCLVINAQDLTADYLLGRTLGTSPILCDKNLSALRFETTKMLLEPLSRLKQADSRLNMTQGVLEGVVGEELGVLPGMDSIFSMLALERLVGFVNNVGRKNYQQENFDVIVYDGISTEETLRMIGATSKARLYLKYLRSMAEKTDLGRLAGPSIVRLVDEAMGISENRSVLNGKMSSEIWDAMESYLERGSKSVSEASTFSCFLVMDPNNSVSVNSALRYWGCMVQAGGQVCGAFALPHSPCEGKEEMVKDSFAPLPFAMIPDPYIKIPPDWHGAVSDDLSQAAREILNGTRSHVEATVNFDMAKKTMRLLMPGFNKSEIKLYQYRGGSELMVEAGDQRRVIHLPPQMQGKVGGAKFVDRSLVITIR